MSDACAETKVSGFLERCAEALSIASQRVRQEYESDIPIEGMAANFLILAFRSVFFLSSGNCAQDSSEFWVMTISMTSLFQRPVR